MFTPKYDTRYAINRSHGPVMVLTVAGHLTVFTDDFLEHLWQDPKLQPEALSTCQCIVVDLQSTTISSKGLSLIVSLKSCFEEVRPDGLIALVVKPGSHVESVLSTTGLSAMFSMYASIDEAIADIRRQLEGK